MARKDGDDDDGMGMSDSGRGRGHAGLEEDDGAGAGGSSGVTEARSGVVILDGCQDGEMALPVAGLTTATDSPARLGVAVARSGWLLLGFVVGAIVAAAALMFLNRPGSPEYSIVPT